MEELCGRCQLIWRHRYFVSGRGQQWRRHIVGSGKAQRSQHQRRVFGGLWPEGQHVIAACENGECIWRFGEVCDRRNDSILDVIVLVLNFA
eukprot:4083683-Ditylum_brightwellii.AAC.1